jgi:hypothetical protein
LRIEMPIENLTEQLFAQREVRTSPLAFFTEHNCTEGTQLH